MMDELLVCPHCHGPLSEKDMPETSLVCAACDLDFPARGHVVEFLKPEELTGTNRSFARFYDCASHFYRFAVPLFFLFLGGEGRFRRMLIRRLRPEGRVLEVSIGTGANIRHLTDEVDEIYGVDISRGQLRQCQKEADRLGVDVRLFLAAGERLPFEDDAFDSVLHFAGINFFSNQEAAIREMCRVARPGAHVLISAETERLARDYRWILPGFSRLFSGDRPAVVVPDGLVPGDMRDVRTELVHRGLFYCIDFFKPIDEESGAVGDERLDREAF